VWEELGQERVRDLLREVVAALERLSRDRVGALAPGAEDVEAALDDAVPSPQREERRADAPGLVGAIVREVDGDRGAVVLAARVNGASPAEPLRSFSRR
jgi:hypothetical protein